MNNRKLILSPVEDARPWYMLDDDELDLSNISSKIIGVNLPTQARHNAEDEQQAVANCTLCGQPLNDENGHGYSRPAEDDTQQQPGEQT